MRARIAFLGLAVLFLAGGARATGPEGSALPFDLGPTASPPFCAAGTQLLAPAATDLLTTPVQERTTQICGTCGTGCAGLAPNAPCGGGGKCVAVGLCARDVFKCECKAP